MNDNIKAGSDIHAGDGGYSLGIQEKYDEFVRGRNQSLGKMRIEELMKKAGTDTSGKWMGIEHAEKFAELIVQECAGVGYDASYYECALNVSNKIKQHFGVEEC
jgi:hypothetical protein